MKGIVTESGGVWPATLARCGGKGVLAAALGDSRATTVHLLHAYASALGERLAVPCVPTLNPPLWEAGHVGWFADWWVARNPERALGAAARPEAPRAPARQARRGLDPDALYHSSAVPHGLRWQLPLPPLSEVLDDLAASLDDTLRALRGAPEDDQGLYFFRLALFHEDMHAEAARYMAQTLGIDLPDAVGTAPPSSHGPVHGTVMVPAQAVQLAWQGEGFAFDNERAQARVPLAAFEIDTEAVAWGAYLPFVEAGAYTDPHWWSPQGWAWREALGQAAPRCLRREAGAWQIRQGSRWQALDPHEAAHHLGFFEAEAWCRWAGRRLPTEAEWLAAVRHSPAVRWGEVWEWTASPFAPFEGFVAHPYRDYSQPWFDGRPVLKGASRATHPRMRHPLYRNFFTPDRDDLWSGFRSVAV
jgi:gamma-glutamyl hercynylcysteine S-oxide synthase